MKKNSKFSELKERFKVSSYYEIYIDTLNFGKKYSIVLITIAIFSFITSLLLISGLNKPDNTEYYAINSTEFEQKIYVTVAGEVNNPGMYEMTTDNRINDAIEKAGGFTENAYTDNINLAQKLTDEQYINVPSTTPDTTEVAPSSSFNGIVNINTATVDELCRLPGIGEEIAKRIIEYRENAGNFKRIIDIQNVEGIGTEKFNKIKNNITI